MSPFFVTRSLLLFLGCAAGAEEDACPAGGCDTPSSGTGEEDWWPSSAGKVGQYGYVPYKQPFDLPSSLAWSRDYPVSEEKQSHSVTLGTTIDRQFNVYVSAHDGIMKHNKDGDLLWKYKPTDPNTTIPTNPGLYEGRVYGSDHMGHVFALDMDSGKEIFRTRLAPAGCGDTGSVTAHAGTVVAALGPEFNGERCRQITAVNASTGDFIWRFQPDDPIWNFMAQFPDDGTVVFQDITGKVYRLMLSDGSLIWKNGGWPFSWTDGTQILYEDVIYAVNTNGCGGPDCHGKVCAYRLDNGRMLWATDVPRPPNAFPVVGRLGPGKGLSVVIPIGQQPRCEPGFFNVPIFDVLPPRVISFFHELSLWLGDSSRFLWGNPVLPTDLYVLDATDGKVQWTWKGPTWYRIQTPGDEEDFMFRYRARTRGACCPNTWGGPKIAADGTIYVGNQNGDFLAIRDANGDGRIDDATEVSRYNTGAAFSGPGSAHAPGMIASASCDTVFVFKS